MGSAANPVRLDPFQHVTEVHWGLKYLALAITVSAAPHGHFPGLAACSGAEWPGGLSVQGWIDRVHYALTAGTLFAWSGAAWHVRSSGYTIEAMPADPGDVTVPDKIGPTPEYPDFTQNAAPLGGDPLPSPAPTRPGAPSEHFLDTMTADLSVTALGPLGDFSTAYCITGVDPDASQTVYPIYDGTMDYAAFSLDVSPLSIKIGHTTYSPIGLLAATDTVLVLCQRNEETA